MKNQFITSSYLIFISAFIGVINLLVSQDLNTIRDYLAGSISFVILIILGILVKMEIKWIRYVLAALVLLGLSYIPLLIQDFKYYSINALISLTQNIIQIIAVIILFLNKKLRN